MGDRACGTPQAIDVVLTSKEMGTDGVSSK